MRNTFVSQLLNIALDNEKIMLLTGDLGFGVMEEFQNKLPNQFLQNIFWERNVDNHYYGHFNILKNYSKTFFPYKINGEVQHGWSAKSGITSEFSSISSLKKVVSILFK